MQSFILSSKSAQFLENMDLRTCTIGPIISKTVAIIANYYDSLLWGSTVGYPSDSLASSYYNYCVVWRSISASISGTV